MAWAALLGLLLLSKADDALDALPSVVVHGRRGPNSNLNGVYIRDYSCEKCFRRPNAGGPAIFLYFEGEWRLGPSPEHSGGLVWAYARSTAPSPLLIDVPWEVWDGQQVLQDQQLRVSDLSAIPQMLELSFGEGSPPELRQAQGVLMQQPGLWDGRPYYKHMAHQELFLLCSTEGWRLGPLPLGLGPGVLAPMLLSRSTAGLPQEILEQWIYWPERRLLPEGTVRLRALGGSAVRTEVAHPQHLVIEGLTAGDGVANGVYRLEKGEAVHPAYHKTDAVRSASLWFTGGDWRFGPSVEDGRVWAYATADQLSSDANWRSFDGQVQELQILDARVAIPQSILISGTEFVQENRLCDARPVYGAVLTRNAENVKVFLYFRAQLEEWWLGPEVGGNEFLARAAGSLLQVIPRMEDLQWRQAVIAEKVAEAPEYKEEPWDWARLVCSLGLASAGILFYFMKEKGTKGRNPKEPALACLVCLEAPRQILLMPCRHVCCCKDCSERLQKCPICRTETRSLQEVFL